MAIAEPKKSPAKSSQYVDFDEFIEFQLKKTRTGIHHTDILSAGVMLCVILLGYLLAFVVFDHWVVPGGIGYGVRVGLLSLLVLGISGWAIWKIVLPYMRQVNALYAAREIERSHPELKSSLLSWVDLRSSGKQISPQILNAIEKRTALEMSHSDVDEAVDRRYLMRASYSLLAIVVLLCAYTVFSPKNISTSIWRALFPTSAVSVSTRTNIMEITPGNSEVLAHDQVDVTVDLSGVIPEETTLLFSTADRRFVDEPIIMRNTGEGLPRFRGRLTGENGKGLLKDVTYRVQAGDTESPDYLIKVNQPPRADVSEVIYEYPIYMGLDRKVQQSSNIDAWEGTWVTVRATPNMELERAMLQCSDEAEGGIRAEEYPMTKNSDGSWSAKWQLKLRSDGTSPNFYHVQVWNNKDESDPLPTFHRLKIRPDLKPEITLIHPTKDFDAPLNSVIPIAFKCNDPDFMLRRVDLKLEKSGEVLPISPRLFSAPPFTSDYNGTYRLDLEKMRFQAGEQFSFYIQAQDNREAIDGISNDTTNSPKITVTIIAPQPDEEVKQFEDQQQQQIKEKIEEATDSTQEGQPAQPQDDPDQGMKPEDRSTDPAAESTETTPSTEDGDMPQQGEPQPGEVGDEGEPQKNGIQKNGTPQEGKGQHDPDQSQKNNAEGTEKKTGDPSAGDNTDSEKDENNVTQQQGQPGENSNGTKQQSSNERQPGQKSSPKEKAADDEALRKLIEWNKEQQKNADKQQTGKQTQPNQDPASKQPEPGKEKPADPFDPQESAQQKSTEKGAGNEDSDQNLNADDNKSMQKNSPSESSTSENSSNDPNAEQAPGQKPSPAENGGADDPQMKKGEDGTQTSESDRNSDSQSPSNEQKPGEASSSTSENKTQKSSDQPAGNQSQDSDQKTMKQDPADSEQSQETSGSSENQDPKQMKPGEGKPGEGKPGEGKPGEGKPGEGKPGEGKPGEGKPGEGKPGEGKPGEGKPGEGKPGEGKPGEGKPGEGKPGEGKPGEGKPGEGKPGEGKPGEGKPGEGKPGEGKPGEGKPGEGKPGEGKPGEGKPGEGKPGEGKPGEGKPGEGKPGEGKPGEGKPGEGKPGEGKPGEGKPGEGKPGEGKPGEGKPGEGKPGEGKPGEGKPGEGKPEDGKPMQGGNPQNGAVQPGDGQGEGSSSTVPEEADLDNKKKATNLALKRLQDQLERGDTPQELLDELGFDQQELETFMNKLDERLADPGIDQSPESEAARRQFESLLKGLDYQSTGEVRGGGDGVRQSAQGFGSANRPIPPEYRLEDEAYKRKLSQQGSK